METAQEYYKGNGPMTALTDNAKQFRTMPKDLAARCEIIQGVLIHRDIAPFLYQVNLSEEQREEAHIRPIEQMLARIHAIDSRPLTTPRETTHRLPSVCRHFSLMLCSILRENSIPARARCGFGAYFNPRQV